MKLVCKTQGDGFLKYPDGAVTVGKTYEIFTDFEIRNTLLFEGDNGVTYKLIPVWFRKRNKLDD